jgi:hypothetical protein
MGWHWRRWRRWWPAAAIIVVAVGGCTNQDEQYCEFDSDCGPNRVCGAPACYSPTICQPEASACRCLLGDGRGVGDQLICAGRPVEPERCNCDSATCAEPLDSCGERLCLGVCQLGDACDFCVSSDVCMSAEPCLGSRCTPDGMGGAVCRPDECTLRVLTPPLCGTPRAPCGEACTEPDCTDLECGPDPVLGTSCGSCGPHRYCTANRCQQSPAYSLCDGDLRATPGEVAVETATGTMPEPLGGPIADGIYDLVAQREYVAFSASAKYDRGAMRFTVGATRVEHIYDATAGSQADAESPHRLMSVHASGSILSFSVTCPEGAVVFDPDYTRGFTAEGTELRLFQENVIEIYERRP